MCGEQGLRGSTTHSSLLCGRPPDELRGPRWNRLAFTSVEGEVQGPVGDERAEALLPRTNEALREKNEVKITMAGYVTDLLSLRPIKRGAVGPALENLFVVNPDAQKLDKAKAEAFHSTVMKMQYLAKRVRPDLLTTSVFLNSRVLEPDVEDNEKLERTLCYL
jgi:hypothetical protein